MVIKHVITIILTIGIIPQNILCQELPKLKISDNNRFLIKEDNTPFLWIGDTFWDWDQLSPSELDEYLNKRTNQGYTVIQTQLAVYGGANYAGDWCFGGAFHKDIIQPQEVYWQYVDLWLDKIESHGLYAAVGLSWIITFWSRYDKAGDPAERFSESDYYNYGKWIGNRYKHRNNIIWLGLNESTYQTAPVEKIKAVSRGICDGDTGDKLISLHPLAGSRIYEEYEDIVDFNSWQTARFFAPSNLPYRYSIRGIPDSISGADVRGEYTVWEAIAADYSKTPIKPVIDLEGWYEGHLDDMPVNSTGTKANAWHVRRRAYFTILAGAFGHTYGATGLAYNIKGDSWQQALHFPGGEDIGHLAKLFGSEERPFLQMVPAQEIIVSGQSCNYDSHKQAARANDGSYAYIYSADGSNFSVDLTDLGENGDEIKVKWFNPREGTFIYESHTFERDTNVVIDPPESPMAGNDWILVLYVER
ncbi:glycoside hydrolase family 140 protein [Bacteroidota bacterium]